MNGSAILASTLAAVWIADALRLRDRARSLRVMAPSSAPVSSDHVFLTRPGVVLDEPTRRAASEYARENGLEALDLVSPRMESWRAILFVVAVDPKRFRRDPFARGYSAGDAVLVHSSLLDRLVTKPAPQNALAFVDLLRTLKLHAATTTDVVVAPALVSAGTSLGERRRLLRMLFGDAIVPMFVFQLALLALALAFAPVWGVVALAVFHLQVVAITIGTPLGARNRWVHAAARTIVDAASTLGPTALAPAPRVTAAELRPVYEALLDRGTARFFDPAREDCSLCGGRELTKVGEFGDHYQRKPGRFVLSRCGGCGHVFQNPRLSIEGLSFYYRDFYDGLGADLTETVFANEMREYRARARMVAAVASPRRWLDVGAGHGHFCCVARELLPDTRFEGLDFSESIDEAVRRRWVDRGIRGLFPDVAPDLAAEGERYDVVSMSHYLEHTLNPAAEIDAAARVLGGGGLLFIEVPDPESRLGRLLGRGWLPWFQPQHLHFLTAENLKKVLVDRAFEPLVWHRGEAHQAAEFTYLTLVVINRVALSADVPWLPAAGRVTRAWRRFVWAAAVPLVGIAWLVDHALAPLLRRKGWSNTYRVLARRVA